MQNEDALLASIFMFKMQIYYFSSFMPASELAPFDVTYMPTLALSTQKWASIDPFILSLQIDIPRI